ncbi:lipid IV(A) 3-deoxy-D-manno-octulosonic acid transferase [Aliivibrio sp. S4TY2]|uniref:lipid IV(A) 3-deoxy-D-manno-octulosonic acid transferase n=1 Tax=unclassified Aliivibrio TaxID=2645654 RepID=UPI002378531F|nr:MULTISPECIES: lipid IV(A) 3-deoxy-D-manno-octulosonic acid transferase [unclassified Aliivibrio]MDD9155997.1 lipid IV(A) 3-deoxy-D-manno-octulosonic acid transferase [Aliivibrio sp. S4TY2]MDD9159706.1 lipid IV(A) 3-deoxy-D-manno-octulosonic acid transferase [Aliivibrio sp. S4TY1]MDD9163706.1 lipid IV(A) 3-deoxy-D-manno-octulosonic acid transferase [Aliivibrio sp. S4MY2]MDD9167706.1 lipid IV(A) 3-deoxy-D-manno-octulosonic acid transferase [Aliivibrio sp. S4MY4]MDD9185630.1 lipid IV(A) 3-deox
MLIRFSYSIILTLISPFLLCSLYKKKEGKPAFGRRWKEHFGCTPSLNTTQAPIWIHAVSVGEAIAAAPIIKALKKQNPEQPILVTTTTSTGAEQIEKLGNLVEHRYMPIDFCFAVRGFLKATKPEKMLIMETELWPNTLHTVAKFGIPISVLNARLSEKSYLGYKKVQPIFNLLAKHLTHVCCQYQDDADRFIALGINKDRVHVTGSVKFDIEITEGVIESGKQLRYTLGSERPVWIAASTHKGEDEQVLVAHQELLKSIPDTLLILVPRHPERFNSVFELCEESGLKAIKRTSNSSISSDIQVYLGDTMGEMLTLIGASDVCFIGGSLLGNKVGGHNLLEPAALAKPSITGPSYYNFLEITETLIKEEATKMVTSSEELSSLLKQLITQPEYAEIMGKNAQDFISKNSGAVIKTLNLL